MLSALLHLFSEDLVFLFCVSFQFTFLPFGKKVSKSTKKLDVATDAKFVFSFVDVDFIIWTLGHHGTRIYDRKQILPNISPLDGGFISLEIKFPLKLGSFERTKMKFPMR